MPDNATDRETTTKILLVEDEGISALAMKIALQSMGFVTCQPAASGRNALEQMAREKPDVVLMDINLSGDLDGIETVRRMPVAGRPIIIFITGYSSPGLLERAKALKPEAIFTKPVRPLDLKSAIDLAIDKSRPH